MRNNCNNCNTLARSSYSREHPGDAEPYDKLLKIVLVGDSDVGKTGYEQLIGKLHFEIDPKQPQNAIIADVIYWSSAKVSDEITTGYINTIVNTMLDIPNQRKKLLTFCGFSGYEKKVEKKLLIDLDVKNEAHELFKDLFG